MMTWKKAHFFYAPSVNFRQRSGEYSLCEVRNCDNRKSLQKIYTAWRRFSTSTSLVRPFSSLIIFCTRSLI